MAANKREMRVSLERDSLCWLQQHHQRGNSLTLEEVGLARAVGANCRWSMFNLSVDVEPDKPHMHGCSSCFGRRFTRWPPTNPTHPTYDIDLGTEGVCYELILVACKPLNDDLHRTGWDVGCGHEQHSLLLLDFYCTCLMYIASSPPGGSGPHTKPSSCLSAPPECLCVLGNQSDMHEI